MREDRQKLTRQGRFGNGALLLVLVGFLAVFLVFGIPGIGWGLPGWKRTALYYRRRDTLDAAVKQIRDHQNAAREYKEALAAGNVAEEPRPLPRSVYNPVRSCHPDEYMMFKLLSRMRPWKLDLDPEWYVIGGGYVYPLGLALKDAEALGLVRLEDDVIYYLSHPDEMAKLYVVGRVLSLAFAFGAVMLVTLCANRLWGAAAGLSAGLFLMLSPLVVMHEHFMYNDVPGMFWVSLTLFSATGILRRAARRHYILAGIAGGLAAGTKLMHGFAILLPLAAHFLRERTPANESPTDPASESGGRDRNTGHRTGSLIVMIIITVFIVLLTNPYYLLRPAEVISNYSRHVWRGPNFAFYLKSWAFGFGLLPLIVALAGVLVAAARRSRSALLLGLWGAGYYVFVSIFGKQFARFLLPAFPSAALLCGFLFQTCLRLLAGGGSSSDSRGSSLSRQSFGGRRLASRLSVVGVFFCFLLVLAPQFAADVDIVLDLNRPDSRTVAGEAIVERLPSGSKIAVTEEPWQFEMPPMDAKRYEIVVTGYDAEKIVRARPKAFVYSELQSDPEVNPHAEIPHEAAFWKKVAAHRRSGEWTTVYETPPTLAALKVLPALGLWKNPPEDMRFVSPRVTVLTPAAR